MTLFISVCVTLLSLFIKQAASAPPASHDRLSVSSSDGFPAPFENGIGPQTNLTFGGPQDTSYFWDADFTLKKGPVPVYGYPSQQIVFNITEDHKTKRGFIINDMQNQTLLMATDKSKAACGFRYTYHTNFGVSYTIDPRFASTDRWYITLNGKDNAPSNFTYYRGRGSDLGTIKFTSNGTFAASFTFQESKASGSTFDRITLTISKSTTAQPQQFVGLWVLVSKRMKRCGA